MGEVLKKLSFVLNRNDARTLVDQVADGLRQAILRGYYRPGESLPSSRRLVELTGASRIVTSAALERLVSEGLVDARTRLGCVVRDRAVKQWRGRVLLICPDGYDSHLQSVFAGTLHERLSDAGYLMSESAVYERKSGVYDLSRIEVELAGGVDLVLLMYARDAIFRFLARRKVPFAVFGEVATPPRGAVGSVLLDYNGAVPSFVEACRRKGVREVVAVVWHELMCDVVPALRLAGVRAQTLKARFDGSCGRIAGVRRAGYEAMADLYRRGLIKRGTLYFFADDQLALGALQALSYYGFRAPEDVLVATWMNSMLGLVYERPLSRMEFNELTASETASDAVLRYLQTGEFPTDVSIASVWNDGETMDFNPTQTNRRRIR